MLKNTQNHPVFHYKNEILLMYYQLSHTFENNYYEIILESLFVFSILDFQ